MAAESTPNMEEAVLENPVLKDNDAAEAAELLKMAQDADARGVPASGEVVDDPISPDPSAQKPVSEPEPVQATDEAKAAAERARDEQGRFTKTPETTPEAAAATSVADPVQPEKPESDYTKAQKEAARRQKTWAGLQEERAEIQRQQAEFQQRQREWEQQRQQQAAQPAPQKFSSQQYDEAAAGFERDAQLHEASGDDAAAAKSFALASKARAAASSLRSQELNEQAKTQQDEFTRVWQQNAKLVEQEHPGILNPQTEMGKKIADLFQEEPMFNYHPQGLRKAVEILKLRESSGEAETLRAKVQQLTAELGKYQKLTAIGGEGPTRPTVAKKFEDMTMEEQGDQLRRMSEQADGN